MTAPALFPAGEAAPATSSRLDRARATLARLAVDGVVELPSAAIAGELGVSTRALRGAVAELEVLGELERGSARGRGRVLRLILKPEGGRWNVEDGSRKAEAVSRKPEAGSRKPEDGSRKAEGDARTVSSSSERHDSFVVVPTGLSNPSSSVVSPPVPEGLRAEDRTREKAEGGSGLALEVELAATLRELRELAERARAAVATLEARASAPDAPRVVPPTAPARAVEEPAETKPSQKAWRPKSRVPVWGPTDDERRAVLDRVRVILESEPSSPSRPLKPIEAQLRDARCYDFMAVRIAMAHVELSVAREGAVHSRRGLFWEATNQLSFKPCNLAIAELDAVDAELGRLRKPAAPAPRLPQARHVPEWWERVQRDDAKGRD